MLTFTHAAEDAQKESLITPKDFGGEQLIRRDDNTMKMSICPPPFWLFEMNNEGEDYDI